MPTYSYRCADCAHAFDIQQAFTDDSLTVCPECGGTLRKVFGNIGVTFSGSGFYRNDSRESSSAGSAAGGSTAAGSTAAKSSTDAGGSTTTSGKDAGAASSAPAKSASVSAASSSSS